jgi:uncharacterized protein (TIGR02246 family)
MPSHETEIVALYQSLLDAWNQRDAAAFAALCDTDTRVVGFDGSTMDVTAEIEAELSRVFESHKTAAYVAIVRRVTSPTANVAILAAHAGMVPPGKSEVNPAVNAVQTLVAVRRVDRWMIAVFQNTPAALHQRDDARERITKELNVLAHRAEKGEAVVERS